jgi:hypothetical protein
MAANILCRFDGKCTKGSGCKYMHRKQGTMNEENNSILKPKLDLCKNGNQCKLGPKCRFGHPPSDSSETDSAEEDTEYSKKNSDNKPANIRTVPPSKPKIKCKDGAACTFRARCWFDHSSDEVVTPSTVDQPK